MRLSNFALRLIPRKIAASRRPLAYSILLCLLGCLALAEPLAAQGTVFPGVTSVAATSQPISVKIVLQKAGQISAIRVLTQGISNSDFIAAGTGSCTVGISYPAGQSCTQPVSFHPTAAGLRSGAVMLSASDGSALGTSFLMGVGSGAVATFVPGEINTFAGHSSWIYNGDGVAATNASIFLPFGMAVDPAGNVYIADSGNNRVRKVTASTGIISTFAGNGTLGDTGDGGSALKATLSNPSSVALDGAGNLYICDSANNAVREVALGTGIITTVAGKLGQIGYSGDGGLATAATLNSPNGIALDFNGNLLIADTANHAVRRVDAVTGLISTVAGVGASGMSGDNGPAAAARLNAPWSIFPDASGQIFIADQDNSKIRKVDANGIITTVAGTGVPGFGGDGTLATAAMLDVPASVVVDAAGNMYIADSGNNRIRKVNASTGVISSIAGTTTQSISGDGGPANTAGLYGPYTLALDGSGNLYIADVFHNRIRIVYANQAVIDFQPMRIGRVAASQTQTLENDGNATMTLSSVQAVSDSVIDGTTTTCFSQLAMEPLKTCAIGAAFAPTALGTPLIGTIAVNSDATNNPGTINLSGNVLSEDPSTVTVAASANPIQANTAVFFTVTVTSSGVVPTGQVSLFDGSTSIATTNLQSGGTATFTVSSLTGGQHVITASYVGDTNNTPGVSLPMTEIVQDVSAPTVTTLAVSANPALAGSPLVLTANVTLVTPGSGNGAISGPVTFTDGNAVLGAATINNGIATLTLSSLAVGPHAITASYSGVPAFSASASAVLALSIQAGTTGTVLTSSANPAPGGGALTLTASVAGNGVAPTGTVTFLDGANPLGSAAVSPLGVATLLLPGSTLAIGSHTILAVYSGDQMNGGSSSAALNLTVVLATTTPTVTSSANPSPQGAPVTLTVVTASTGGIPTGTVEFFDGTLSLGTATLDPTGTATLVTSTLGLGAHALTVNYDGDAMDATSTSAVLNQQIIPATTTVSLTSSANPASFGSALAFTVIVQGTGPQPFGSIALQDGGTTIGVQQLDASGTTNFINVNLAIGMHNLTALYSGDVDHAANNATLTQRVMQVTSIALGSATPAAFAGVPVTWTASVLGASSQPLSGTVQFMDGAAPLASVPVDQNGNAAFTSASLAIGVHRILASYSGDQLDQAATAAPLMQMVQIGTTGTALSSSANPSFAGSSLTLNANISSNGATPTGTIKFLDGSTVLGLVPLNGSTSASLSLSTLTPGSHNLSAVYSGDANESPSPSATLLESIVQQTVLTTNSTANPSMFGDAVNITVSVSGWLAAYPPRGQVTLTDGGNVVGSALPDALGNAYFTLTAPSLGAHVLVATYAGDSNNSPATANSFTQTVTLRPTTTTFVSSATQLSAGSSVTFIGLVQGVGPHIPTGIVTFASGSTVLGTATLNAAGLATMTFVPQQGVYAVVAQYPGDSLFAASNGAPTTVTVGPTVEFTINMTPSSLSMPTGDHKTLQIAINTASTFNDTLQLGCAGLPASATCTFSTNNIKVAGGATSSLSVVVDTGTPLGAGPVASLDTVNSRGPLSCLLPGAALLALLLMPARRYRKQLRLLMAFFLVGTLGMLSGCANSLTVNTTPAGTYVFQIIGTGQNSGATQSGAVTLTVTN